MTHLNRRQFIGASLTVGAASLFPAPAQIARGANENVRIGAIGGGIRGNEHIAAFRKMDDVAVVAVCDPDSSRVDSTVKKHELSNVKTFSDCRQLIDDKDIDAVVITTCDHWHCLAAIWAMQAGKDVYVEKPLAHNVYEGIQACNAARKYKRICQVGMQQRSDKMQVEIKRFLHEEKQLGAIKAARVNHYMPRNPIGLRDTPLDFPTTVDKNLWLGPALDMPMYRNTLQYDWHWSFNTGTGEMGNWGVHVLDDCRNNVLLDAMEFPKRIIGGGIRGGEKDDGETPNIHFVYFDTGAIPVVLGLSTLAMKDQKSAGPHPGPGSGYIAYCEGGRLEGQRGSAKAFDEDGNQYVDFLAGCGALNYGHNNGEIKGDIIDYLLKDNITHAMDMYTGAKADFIKTFKEKILDPKGLSYKIMFCGSTGTNAVEAALKLARKNKKRSNVIAFMGAFHGMTLGSLALTTDRTSRDGAGVSLDNVSFVPFESVLSLAFSLILRDSSMALALSGLKSL